MLRCLRNAGTRVLFPARRSARHRTARQIPSVPATHGDWRVPRRQIPPRDREPSRAGEGRQTGDPLHRRGGHDVPRPATRAERQTRIGVRIARMPRPAAETAFPEFDVAVEVNSRPERLDPPKRLLRLAVEAGCKVAIDTDAHAPGQLDWQHLGCERAYLTGVTVDRIVNAWPADELLAWTGRAR